MTMIRDQRPLRSKERKNEQRTNHNKQRPEPVLPPIVIALRIARRLNTLANSSVVLFPRVARFLARETERAQVVTDDSDLRGIVRMGSQVRYCDDETGEVRDVVLVYPHEADISLKRISVLTPVGAALDWLVGWPGHRISDAGPSKALTQDFGRVVLKIGSVDVRDVSMREAVLSVIYSIIAIVVFLGGLAYVTSIL